MKKLFTTIAILLFLAANPLITNAEEIIEPSNVTNSGCTRSDDPYNNEEQEELEISYQDGLLTATWINYIANCCLEEDFKAWITQIDNQTLKFNVEVDDGECDCMCTYDVTSTYQNIQPGTYTIIFGSFSTEVTIEEGCDYKFSKGTIGIQTLAENNDMLWISPDGILHVAGEEPVSVEIYDAAGVLRARLNLDSDSDLNITTLQSGIYLAKAKFGNRTVVIRFARF